jgi:hypothetical protein
MINDVCVHLQPILKFISAEYGMTVVERVNGKGWGLGVLVSSQLPFDQILDSLDIPDCVTLSVDKHVISCSNCWTNIAEHSAYKESWG